MKTYLLVILLTFLSIGSVLGAQESYVNRMEGSSFAINGTYSTYDSHYWDMLGNANWHTLFTNQKVSNYVRLGVRQDFVQMATFSATVQVQIDYQTWGASGLYTAGSTTQTLTVNYDANGNNTISDLNTYSFSNAHLVKVKILSMSGSGSYNKEYVYLETGIDVERYYAFNNQTAVTSTISTIAPNDIQIAWNVVPGAEFYEVEYVHVNKYTLTNGTYIPTNQLNYNFYLNSTRVDVTNTYYKLPKIFDKGYFLYRIRAIGKKGTNFAERDNGVWNVVESGTVAGLIASYPNNYMDINTEYDAQMNWTHQIGFSEGGKRMEAVSFSDGLGKKRQQVKLNPENGQVVVSTVYYDELGRLAVSSLPTPVSNDYLRHFKDFNRANLTDPDEGPYPSYKSKYFNVLATGCPPTSIGFAPTSGAGKYYSTSNTNQDGSNKMIPDAETFPFSRITYLNDLTGRVNRASAAGTDLKMGSGKETKFVYESPLQEELNKLFGVEVGDKDNYQKITTIDPNGQVYIRYLDASGRVVASYMEGDCPANVNPLDDNVIVLDSYQILSPGGSQTMDQTLPSAEVVFTKFIASAGDYTFEYGFTPSQYQSACLPSEICFDCLYDLEIEILDECSNVVYENSALIPGSQFDLLCNGGNFDDLSITLALTQQTYRIRKKLTVNQASIDEYWCLFLENNTCIESLSDLFNSSYVNEPFENCKPFVAEEIEPAGPCDDFKEAMLSDLRPGGQYAKYTLTGGTYTTPDVWSILNPASSNAYPTTIDWQNPPSPYLDANGINVTTSVTSQGLGYFITNFRDEWAELFLPYHPEYCHLQYCLSNGASQSYDAAVMDIIEYDVAMDGNYFEPIVEVTNINGLARSTCKTFQTDLETHTAILDPFFSNPANVTYKTAMTNAMQSYITLDGTAWGGANVTLSLWQYVIYLVNNCSPNVSPVSCIDKCYECKNDQIWLTFRDLYMELKNKYVMLAQQAYAHANCPASACIGVNPTTCTGANALLAGKVPNFVNTLMYSPIINAANPADVYNDIVQENCQTSCDEFADQWIADLAGCDFVGHSVNLTLLKQDLVALCMAGCTTEHPMGSSTAPAGSTFETINEVLQHHLGSGFETSLCSDLLISEPGPYEDIATGGSEEILAPVDTCGCNFYMSHQQNYEQALINGNVPTGIDNLEEWINLQTGIFLEDVDEILCTCKKYKTGGVWSNGANAALMSTGIKIPANVSCDNTSCIDCSQLDAGITALVVRLNDVADLQGLQQSPTYQVILTNYFNSTYGFKLNAWDYMDFISRCHATSDNPYCKDNPLMSEWMLQMSVLAMRGQLTTSVSNLDLAAQNIVYSGGELKDNGQGNILNSSLSGNTLTLNYTGSGYTACNFTLTLPVGATFGFEDIVYFEDFNIAGEGCGLHNDFTCTVSYYECGIRKYADLSGTSSCMAVRNCICSSNSETLCYDPFAVEHVDCYQPELDHLISSAFENYDEMIQQTYLDFKEDYKTKCAAAFQTEHEALLGGFTQYQFTLFYYDQAGNLARTVAPEGVHRLASANNAAINTARNGVISSVNYPAVVPGTTKPVNDYVTTYNYNSYNQLVSTTNPDQRNAVNAALLGESKYWYDRYGRLVASQNPLQASQNKYSYVLFDAQGRPVQTGQTVKTLPPNETTELKVNDYGTAFTAWVTSGTRSEVTVTQYDKALSAAVQAKFVTGTQDNLRLRVASILYFATVSGSTNWSVDYETATHYSYDIHGNVKEQIQDVPMLAVVGQTNKSTQYEYELVSGNVNKVVYQKDKADQITHTYKYDKLNRLEEASSSTDKVHTDRHVKYYYFDYGPLARVEFGQNKVQSMDYTYTINRWIKGMNSSTLDNSRDVGKDGSLGYFSANNQEHLENAIDVSAYTLGYFANDYKAIAGSTGFEADYSSGSFGTGSPGLYNGNIRSVVTSIVGMPTLGSAYKYDQLNRLLSMDAYYNTTGLASSNNWTSGTLSQDYKSNYSYDRNGNLKTLLRNGPSSQLTMDNFTYNGYNTAPGTPWNRLDYVTDGVTTSSLDDIKNGQSTGNYKYDALGQLTADVSEGIQTITWRFGDKKVQKIERNSTKPNASQLEFIYNPLGQRVLKIEKPRVSGVLQASNTWKYSYYSYDASGRVLAVYDLVLGTTTQKADLNELHLYGLSKVGIIEHPVSLWNNGAVAYTPGNLTTHKSGEMRYEISNYLGNVNAVVNDRKIPRSGYIRTPFNQVGDVTGWSGVSATVDVSGGYLRVVPSVSGSSTSRTFTGLNVGKRYILRVRANRGSGPDLRVAITGVAGTTTLLNTQQNTILFTATSASTTVTISQVSSSTATYWVDQLELGEDHIYEATLIMSCDYYPFGMQMAGRSTNPASYRYGYNGMEKDDETKGLSGSSYTTEFRQYDPRLGRWASLDPLMMKFPWMSPYTAFDNNPIYFTDPYGLESGTKEDPGTQTLPEGLPSNPKHEQVATAKNGKKYQYIVGDDGKGSWGNYTEEVVIYGFKTKGECENCKDITVGDGDIVSDVQHATYQIKMEKIDKKDFDGFKNAFSINPGWITNNWYATYRLIDRDKSGGLSANDHIDIDINGDDGSVRVKSVTVGDNFISANFITLEGHPDAGEIRFYGVYDPSSKTMTFTITNITQTNVVGSAVGGAYVGRNCQKDQWKKVLCNVGKIMNAWGKVVSATLTIVEYDYDDDSPNKMGEIEDVERENMTKYILKQN